MSRKFMWKSLFQSSYRAYEMKIFKFHFHGIFIFFAVKWKNGSEARTHDVTTRMCFRRLWWIKWRAWNKKQFLWGAMRYEHRFYLFLWFDWSFTHSDYCFSAAFFSGFSNMSHTSCGDSFFACVFLWCFMIYARIKWIFVYAFFLVF